MTCPFPEAPLLLRLQIYETLQRLLSKDLDLLREFQEYIPESCTNMKYVHTVLQEPKGN
jgi:hypothetical protein